MTTVGELIEKSLYLSLKDRYFNNLPTDPTDRDNILIGYLTDLNKVLKAIGKKNPAFSRVKVSSNDLKVDTDLNMSYVDLKENPFLTLFRVEFLYSGDTFSITLTRLGMNDFFSNSDLRTLYTFPAFYNYNTFSGKLYIYPKPSVAGNINIFGKKDIANEDGSAFSSLEDVFPDYISDTFLLYLEYFFGKFLCSQYNAPWQAQKEEMLRSYGKLVDSENNISYQELSINNGQFAVPIRNTRVGL